ncbi:DUF7322 domain-containing protein [Natrialba sp. SSL1]|uniref:DUF7322 domain-containing protein n=1 Tax=Natrialba sp. SSL1 TaxID=1869245 RepID=UPI0008F968D6|nr:hypothetical protein [Natrialba sp. SSL1]OIB56063.1 hypothetical protein BBD46_21015 [Natrialba sp. SSL1]
MLDPSDDDPFEDPFGDDPLDDPFGDGSTGDGEADEDIASTFESIDRSTLLAFVTVGVLVHGGIFAASLGAMLVGFRGQWVVGGSLAVAGVAALVLSVGIYRRYKAKEDA